MTNVEGISRELQTSSPDLLDIGRDFGLSLLSCAPFRLLSQNFRVGEGRGLLGISLEVEDGGLELFSKRRRVVGDLSEGDLVENFVKTMSKLG